MSRAARERSIVLIGFFGTGKSEVGLQLALRKGWRFLEVEDLVEEALGLPLPWIISELGTLAFRDAESATLKKLTKLKKEPAAIIAACAPVVRRPANIARLQALGTVVHLTTNKPTLLARLGDGIGRPLMPEGDVVRTVRRLFGSWEPVYHKAADLTVDTSLLTPEEVAALIQESLDGGHLECAGQGNPEECLISEG